MADDSNTVVRLIECFECGARRRDIFCTIAHEAKIRAALKEYKSAQRDQIRAGCASHEAGVARIRPDDVAAVLLAKSESCRADAVREHAAARVFAAAAGLVRALEEAGLCSEVGAGG